MNYRARHLISVGLLLAGLTAAEAVAPGSLQVLGARSLAAQTVRQGEVQRFLEARRAINAEEFERAVALFRAVRTESSLTSPPFEPDSYYWEAFALYRLGDLAEARLLLETLMIGFHEAQPVDQHGRHLPGRLYQDARALEFEIRSQLASSGDAGDAEALLRDAEATLEAFPTMPGFRVMPVEVAGEIVSLPVSVADLAVYGDSLAASAAVDAQADWMIAELYSRADTMLSEGHAQADSTMADVHARVDSLAAALRGQPQPTGQAPVQSVAPVGQNTADYEERVAEYQRQAEEYQQQLAAYDWQRAEYQEASRAAAQERQPCDDVSVQLAALEAVMRYDEINRMQVLRGVLEREDGCSTRLHEEAVELIGRQETLEAQSVLLNVVHRHPEKSVRRAALQELWRFDSEIAFSVLRETLAVSDDEALQSDAIGGLRTTRYAKNSSAPTAIQNALISAVINRSKSERIRTSAIRALRDRDHVEGGIFVRIYDQLDSDDLKESLLSSVASKVGEKEDMETAAWARSVAFDPEASNAVRGAAFSAWAAHPTVTVAYLTDLYGELSEPFLKRQAIYAIYMRSRSDPTAPSVLMELIRNEPDREVRERGIYWLGRTESEEAVEFLLELLSPPATDTVPRRPE